MTAVDYAEVLNHYISNHRNVIVAHDSVHPDRALCGGVGGCALMMAEADLEREITTALERLARFGYHAQVVLA